jgi:Lrp/AsnC family leucine-responsive transcriptional regulator
MPSHTLDALDRRILTALQDDGKLSNIKLAQRIGLSPSPCLRRVTRLEHDGYIESYRAVLGRDRVGLGLTVFVEIRIAGHADQRAEAFEQAIVAMPEVVACHMVSGKADYLVEVVVPDLAAYRRFLVDKLLDLSLVSEVCSNVAIETLKAAAALPLDHLDRSTREPASPRAPAGRTARDRRHRRARRAPR